MKLALVLTVVLIMTQLDVILTTLYPTLSVLFQERRDGAAFNSSVYTVTLICREYPSLVLIFRDRLLSLHEQQGKSFEVRLFPRTALLVPFPL